MGISVNQETDRNVNIDYASLAERMRGILPAARVREAEMLKAHTTFRVGGPADLYVTAETEEELAAVLALLGETKTPWFLLGNGSNLLVGDKGYRGCIITLGGAFCAVRREGNRVIAGGGALLSSAAKAAYEAGLTGMEFASGIPGTVGGGVRMNAGAYGGEIRQIAESVRIMTPEGEVQILPGEAMEFGYRHSVLVDRPAIVLETTFVLKEGVGEEILALMQDLAGRRRDKQPLEFPSAGSTFKRPEGYFAGKLIQDAGLANYRVGGASVSGKHCGFVVSDGTATAADVMGVIRDVQARVMETSGVSLETEVIFLGEFA